jgi:hypothetical protein
VSCTVTLKLPSTVFPSESVTEQDTVVVVMGKVSPELCEQVGVSGPSCASVAVTLKLTALPPGPVASTVMSPGRLSVGSWLMIVG